MTVFRSFMLALALGATPLAALAATVATVDVDARLNGSTDTVNRVDTTNFVPVQLDAGVYEIKPISGAFDALSVWSGNEGCDQDGANCTKGFFWRVDISWNDGNDFLRLNSNTPLLADPAEALALAQTQTFATFTLLAPGTVRFGLFDTPLGDNRGGVSFNIDSVAAVPLPATAVVLLSGLALMGGLRARRG